MATAVKVNVGARLYRDSLTAAFSHIFNGTTLARLSLYGSGVTASIADYIQGNNSICGRVATAPIFGTWDHGHIQSAVAPNVDNIQKYQSFIWFGVVNGFLQVEVFDGRPVAGGIGNLDWGTLTNITITDPDPLPINQCVGVAFTAAWVNGAGQIGTYKLFVNGTQKAVGTTNATTGHGTGDFFLDFPSLTVGLTKDSYHNSVGSMRIMNLRGSSTTYSPAQLLFDSGFCNTPLGGDKFDFPLDTANGLHNNPNTGPGADLVLDAGTIDQSVLDCCAQPTTSDLSGLYFVNPANRRDKYYDTDRKIPNPTVRTAFIGE